MNFRKLKIFYETAMELNMTKVGKKLYISQPSVSQAIHEIEEDLEVKLFDRIGKKLTLTNEGEIYLKYVRRILNLYEEGIHKIKDINQNNGGEIRIGASTTIGIYILPQIIKKFSKKYPNVKIALTINNTEKIESQILRNEVDFAFIEGNIKSDEIESEVFWKDSLIFIGTEDMEIDLNNLNLIMRERGSGTREIVEEALKSKEIEFNIKMELGSTEAIKRSVESGMGMGCVSKRCIEREVESGILKVLNVGNFEINRNLYFLKHKDKFINNNMQMFIQLSQESN